MSHRVCAVCIFSVLIIKRFAKILFDSQDNKKLKKSRVVILSDSLGRPRPDIDKINRTIYADVYGFLLRNYLGVEYEVDICYVDSLDTQDAVYWSQRMVAFREPDIAIFHLGVNDAAPRLFAKNSRAFILKPWFRKITCDILFKIVNRYRFFFTKVNQKTYTTKSLFKKNLLEMVQEVKKYNENVLVLGVSICFGSEKISKKSYGYNKNISEYNAIIQEVFCHGFIDINQIVPACKLLIDDGIHLTKFAHNLLALEIAKRINIIRD